MCLFIVNTVLFFILKMNRSGDSSSNLVSSLTPSTGTGKEIFDCRSRTRARTSAIEARIKIRTTKLLYKIASQTCFTKLLRFTVSISMVVRKQQQPSLLKR